MSEKDLITEKFKENNYSLLVAKNNEIVKESFAKGIGELLALYDNQPELLKNSFVADKIVGAAAASVYQLSEINYCYAKIISQKAVDIFTKNKINFNFEKKVKHIKNRANNGLCPIEKLALEAENETKAIKKIKDFIKS